MSMATGSGSSDFNSEINVTPMVDIMLVLLIIFMVITPLLQQGITVTLPKNLNNPEEDPAIIKKSSVVVAITSDNKMFVNKDPVDEKELTEKINKLMEDPENQKPERRIVYIRADVAAKYETVVNAIQAVRNAGIDQIGLVADKKKGGGASPAVPGVNAPKAGA